ncbi:hypothetical protein M2152_001761 [Microbacteriaceae bacterium SG_E_30_P1]|uniref:Uncharacterized protein n=1 Tax=Antiquaquibacter oligotrophicus TaxID=2880260 RepID=A0ABT6KNZ0_9MICO|nr:hypothetical protein [Antiquaquibacter oligotrophicus]MDH6181579.1 hypothetical protein [Antiquaquibacter oligotrophicus]UDF12735.1 hypothetical protein LH407_11295 [Antiquaquibacter oligotrophicus]
MKTSATSLLLATIAIVASPTVAANASDTDPVPPVVAEVLADASTEAVLDGTSVQVDTAGVAIELPADPSEPVVLATDVGTEVTVGLPVSGEGTSQLKPEDSAVVHDSGDGSEIIPLVREDGTLQILSVLDDERSPTAFSYPISATAAVALVEIPGGGVAAIDDAGDAVIEIEAPWALDSRGRDVPTRFAIDGMTLTQTIDTSSLTPDDFPVVADPAITVTTYQYSYINVSRTYNWANKSKQLGICKVLSGAGGGTCKISTSYSVTGSANVDFGLTASAVSAGIGISASRTVTGTVSWTSPKAPVGSAFKAWSVGTRVTYQIQKWKVTKAGGITTRKLVATSSTLSAFEPVKGFAVGQ